jgi:hypothetical protein
MRGRKETKELELSISTVTNVKLNNTTTKVIDSSII